MDVLKRIDEIMRKQHLNDYQLSKLSGLSTSTISNMRKRNTIPSIATLEYICDSFDMTLSQFFVDEGTLLYPVNDTQKDFLDYFIFLTEEKKNSNSAKLLPPRWIRKIILKVLQQKKTVLQNSLHK